MRTPSVRIPDDLDWYLTEMEYEVGELAREGIRRKMVNDAKSVCALCGRIIYVDTRTYPGGPLPIESVTLEFPQSHPQYEGAPREEDVWPADGISVDVCDRHPEEQAVHGLWLDEAEHVHRHPPDRRFGTGDWFRVFQYYVERAAVRKATISFDAPERLAEPHAHRLVTDRDELLKSVPPSQSGDHPERAFWPMFVFVARRERRHGLPTVVNRTFGSVAEAEPRFGVFRTTDATTRLQHREGHHCPTCGFLLDFHDFECPACSIRTDACDICRDGVYGAPVTEEGVEVRRCTTCEASVTVEEHETARRNSWGG
jgi:hypothetical protein